MTFASGTQPALKHMLPLACSVPFPFIKLLEKKVFYSLYFRLMERNFNHIFKNQSALTNWNIPKLKKNLMH